MKKYLTIDEVAVILDKPVLTIKTETSRSPQNLPPFGKIGGLIRFDPDQIQPWFASKIVNPLTVVIDAEKQAKSKAGRPVKGG